ncbi:MAG TPA: hypothetical protein VI389_00290 [Geobacteraceae bacterium]
MNIAVLAVIICAVLAGPAAGGAPPQTFDVESHAGVAETGGQGGGCLVIANGELAANEPVTLIVPQKPQETLQAVISEKLSVNCSRNVSIPPGSSFYSLRTKESAADIVSPMVAVVRFTGSFASTDGVVRSDLDRDGTSEFFRICAGTEGLHLTIWAGEPAKGKRLWHRYYYLGYDVEPNCTERDYEP